VNQHDQVSLAGTMMMTVVGLVLLIACVNLAKPFAGEGRAT